MPTFRYRAATQTGELVTGTLDAFDLNDAVARVHAGGQVPLRIEAERAASGRVPWRLRLGRGISADDVSGFTRELATLLGAGLALDRALAMLAGLTANPQLAAVVRDVRQRVQAGAPLTEALAAQSGVFSPFAVNLVRAGEAGGALEAVLERLAEHQERVRALRDTVVASLIYPAILVVVALLAVILLLTYVVPQFAQLFADVGQTLPLATRVVIGAGELLQGYGWLLAAVVALAVWALRSAWRRAGARQRLEGALLRVPLLGALWVQVETARLARTLATLLGSGVPLLAALGIAREGVGCRVLSESLMRAAGQVRGGARFADALHDEGRWPALAVQLIRVGEESGDLEAMLYRVAEVYDRGVQTSLKRGLAVLEPVLILVLGLLVAGIVMSILLAILGVNELVV